MKKVLLFLFVVFLSFNGFSQKNKDEQEINIVIHNVKLGETVKTISRKYLVPPSEIYKFNKFAVEGIKEGMALQIPVPVKEEAVKLTGREDVEMNEGTTTVTTTTTKSNGTTTKEVKNNSSGNPTSKPVVILKPVEPKVNQPVKPVAVVEKVIKTTETKIAQPVKPVVTNNKTETQHTVATKETLYSLSKMYGVSVEDIKASNPTLEQTGLQIGQVITINSTKAAEKTTNITDTVSEYKVEPKETLYSLSKKFNISIDKLNELNPELAIHGLQIGQIIKLK